MGAPQYEQAGADIGGTGTTNTIPRWTGPSTLGDSGLIDNGTAIYTTTRTVGIGTATPASALHVRNNTSGITLDSTLGSGRQYQLNQLRTGVSNAGFEIRDVTAGAAVISIDASQNVGIGTASPAGRLDVVGVAGLSWAIRAQVSSANTSPALNAELGLNLKNTSSTVGNYTSITNRDSADNANTQINFINVNNSGSGAINFVTRDSVGGSAERARIDSAGSVCINTTNARTSRFSVEQTGTGTKLATFSNAVDADFEIKSASAGLLTIGTGTGTLAIQSGGTERMRVSNSGVASASQVAIGTSSFTTGCSLTVTQSIDASQSAQGLKLPATPGNADTQTLDCYQEGTWAPTLTAFDGTAPTATTARYTRIGRVVYFEVVLSATGAANFGSTWGNTKVSLPFAPANTIAIPINRNAIGSCGTTSGSDILLTTYAQNAETMRLTGFFSV